MRTRAVGLALEERGAVSSTGALHGFSSGVMDSQHVIAVNLDPGEAVGRTARGHTRIPGGVAEGHFSSELVVLAYEEHWQPPNARHVQTLVERAIVHRAITKECDCHAISLEQLETVARPGGLQNTRPNDAARAHESNLRREQVHAPAASVRTADFTSE